MYFFPPCNISLLFFVSSTMLSSSDAEFAARVLFTYQFNVLATLLLGSPVLSLILTLMLPLGLIAGVDGQWPLVVSGAAGLLVGGVLHWDLAAYTGGLHSYIALAAYAMTGLLGELHTDPHNYPVGALITWSLLVVVVACDFATAQTVTRHLMAVVLAWATLAALVLAETRVGMWAWHAGLQTVIVLTSMAARRSVSL